MPHAVAEVCKIDALKKATTNPKFFFLDNQNSLFISLKGILCFIKLMFLTLANEVLTFNYTLSLFLLLYTEIAAYRILPGRKFVIL